MNILSDSEQNKLSRLYPIQFGPRNYTTKLKFALQELEFKALHAKEMAEQRYKKRVQAGAIATGALGIVGSNLDKCNTSPGGKIKKETRAGLFKAQNMLQKIRLDGEPIISKTCCGCGKPLGHAVEIQSNMEHGSSSINGIQTCGSVWSCPVCRNRIISRRSEELKRIYAAWKERDGHCYMLTLTVPHSKSDNLAKLYGSNLTGTGLSAALSKFRQSRDFSKDFKDRADYFGDIRCVEVTWGRENGFHPHIHVLILTKNTVEFEEWKSRFYEAWCRACTKSDLGLPSWEHGIKLTYCANSESAAYLAKWSAPNEIASNSIKQAKKGNFSIHELERCLYDVDYRNTRKMGMTRAASVLRAYYAAMKGQRMLQTGGISSERNWKEELLGQDEDNTENYRTICTLDYRVYIKIKRAGQLCELLEASETTEKYCLPIDQVKWWLVEHGYKPDAAGRPVQKNLWPKHYVPPRFLA